ncbi:GNAT family N-acetyltransferase [uncultured Algibacter sp.]|uniref:GNAT family N-acetyltransferase n=1 Tax=uncultured Algibacter sp. TaxID=298659 RepID=UPI0030EEDEEE|tara:strand:- start:325 stop:876 length:552 start_codon:yes stop_codon:yes gene_type:complete
MDIQTFPEIKTERLTLRKIEVTDSDVILFLRSDKTINKFIDRPEDRKTKNISDAIKHIKKLNTDFENNKSISWGITLNNNTKIIGTICLWNFSEDYKTAEVGYDLNPTFQRKGIMSEALKRVVSFGFIELKINKIEAFTHIQNENSKKLLEKNGFHLIEHKKDDDNLSNVVYQIIKNQQTTKH